MDEFGRLVTLSDLDLDYSALKDTFSDIAELASMIAGTKISLINLVDAYTQWTVSSFGFGGTQMPREDSVCQYTIRGHDALEVKDLTKDPRFQDKFYVREDPNLRYYMGVPLEYEPGNNIGALCVMDSDIKELSEQQIQMLKGLARIAVSRFKLLKLAAEQAGQLNENKTTLRRIAHDIRSPLSGVIGLCDIILQDDASFSPGELLEYVRMINQGAKSTLELADSALRSQLEEETRGTVEGFNLEELARSIETLYQPQAISKEVQLVISGRSEAMTIPIPKNRILQIVGNLISNAIKFTPPKGKVQVYLNLVLEGDKKMLDIQVNDTGIGMSSELLQNLTLKRMESTAGTSGETGYGFGLPLVKRMVDLMEGQIQVTSAPNEGSHFDVRIPCKI